MEINLIANVPLDGTRIILNYWPRLYRGGNWTRTMESKWEEMRYIEGNFEAWCGDHRVRSSNEVALKDCIAWMPVP